MIKKSIHNNVEIYKYPNSVKLTFTVGCQMDFIRNTLVDNLPATYILVKNIQHSDRGKFSLIFADPQAKK